jgi:uncharacterized surface protein with fasciclin (FAS1) repeats
MIHDDETRFSNHWDFHCSLDWYLHRYPGKKEAKETDLITTAIDNGFAVLADALTTVNSSLFLALLEESSSPE